MRHSTDIGSGVRKVPEMVVVPLTGSCPLGIEIQDRMVGADELLRMT